MPKQANILYIMADQWSALAGGGAYQHPVVKTPNIDKLAQNGVVFDNFYANSPLCAPSRFAMMTGLLPSKTGGYDNASELPSSTPTLAHHLRHLGYHTCLSGKMHFVGADQLHGFEQRLTTDIYPADFGWTVNWDEPEERIDWWYHNMLSVKQAGIAQTSNQLEYDDAVGNQAIQYLYQRARSQNDKQPFALCASFTHPHDPYATRQKYWDKYQHDEIDLPRVPPIAYADLDPHSQRIHNACAMGELDISDDDVRRARHAYYGNISYIDEWVGRLVEVLEQTGLRENTIIIVSSDHGDMLGERGLWYKMNFFENACRVPAIISAPQIYAPGRIPNNCSLIDLLPTFVEMAGGINVSTPHDGRSLVPLLEGREQQDPDEVFGEYMGEGSVAPIFMIKRANHKFIWCECDPNQLYDLDNDPDELNNLSGQNAFSTLEAKFEKEVQQRWNVKQIKNAVLEDQRRRHFVADALTIGHYHSWDYQPIQDAGTQFMRNHLDLNDLEARTRYPVPRKYPEDP